MITRKQAEEVADTILEPHKKELSAKKGKRERLRSIQRRRRESPLGPALFAATMTYTSLTFTESALFAVMFGAGVGWLFGWAARRS